MIQVVTKGTKKLIRITIQTTAIRKKTIMLIRKLKCFKRIEVKTISKINSLVDLIKLLHNIKRLTVNFNSIDLKP